MTGNDARAKPKKKVKAKNKKAAKKGKPSAKKSLYRKAANAATLTIDAVKQRPLVIFPMLLCFLYYALKMVATKQSIEYRIGDSDVGWHIMAGYNIWDNGLSSYDPFGFTNIGYDWYNISWLWDMFVSALDAGFGIGSMVVLVSLCSGITAAYLCYHAFSRGASAVATLATLYIASLNLLMAMTARPHLLTYLLLLLFLDVLRRYVDGKFDRRALILLLLPYLVWVNSHGHFVIGLCITGAYGLELMWRRDWKKFKELFIFGAVCTALILVNPFGYHIIEGMRRTTEGLFRPHITEWQPLGGFTKYPFIIFSLVVIGLTAFRQRVADLVLVTIWMIKAYYASRFLVIYTLFAVPPAAYGLSVIFYHIKHVGKTELSLMEVLQHKYVRMGSWVTGGVVALAILFSPAYYDYEPPTKFMPKSEIKYIKFAYPGARIFNLYDYGGYMLYYAHGQEKTFFDGRADTAFPPELVRDYIKVKMLQPGWQFIADKYNIDIFFWPLRSPQTQGMLRTGRWKQEYTNGRAAVLVRTTPMPSGPLF